MGRAVCINMECKVPFVGSAGNYPDARCCRAGEGAILFGESASPSQDSAIYHFSIDRTRSGTVDLPRACFEFKSMLHRPTHTTTVQARIASGLSRCTDQPPTYLSLWFGLSLHFHFQHHTFTMAVVRLHECAKNLLRRLAGRMASCCSRRRRRSVPLRTAER